jgi:hypothetical protein
VDPVTNKQVGDQIPVGHQPYGVAVGLGSVWIASRDGTILQVFLGTQSVAKTIRVGGNITDIAVGAGSVWVTVDVP